MSINPELLLSLPSTVCQQLDQFKPEVARRAFATYDPPDAQLGSGGGTVHVLHEAWKNGATDGSFSDWLQARQRVVIHGGGESRRLPAYAGVGKLFIPMPALRWSQGQRLGQTLLDLNEPFLREAFQNAGESARVMIASGDVMLRSNAPIKPLADVDVLLLGMWTTPEIAQNYGVMLCDRHDPTQLVSFLQKPSVDDIRDRSRENQFLIDVGVWLLSQRAVQCLMAKCGWQDGADVFADGEVPNSYDLYGEWSRHLGSDPLEDDDDVSKLSVAVAPIDGGEFYHFGTTSDVIESMYDLQNIVSDQSRLGAVPSLAQPKQFVQDTKFDVPLRRQENEALWVEGSHISNTWSLGKRHMLTGVPENDWKISLEDGVCLDFVPVNDGQMAIRQYGFDDRFRGPVSDSATQWVQRPAMAWFEDRSIDLAAAGIGPEDDLQVAKLFPVLDAEKIDQNFVSWLISTTPSGVAGHAGHQKTWLDAKRVSARDLGRVVNLECVVQTRAKLREAALPVMVGHGSQSVFYKLDLGHVAKTYAQSEQALPAPVSDRSDLMIAVHDRMFRSEVYKCRDDDRWQQEEALAFGLLEEAIVEPYRQQVVLPSNQLLNDQIVWARSPVRVDLAGGWTDTPPYCLEHGGSVLNIGLDLNGQPPIQAFARRCDDLSITIRSIDLGVSEKITTYEQVGGYRGLGSGFSVAKAALCLCGFHPEFNGANFETLRQQLEAFGGGIEITMLAAVPKGSGLGTSSILSGTLLGALCEMCGLNWDPHSLAGQVSAVEQMLGSGGGWQDQFGGLLPGAKLIETQPGMSQAASVRWLPTAFFESADFESRALLYYTGTTRVAHDVLGEIVRGMFLNDPARLSVLASIGRNSRQCFEAIQRMDFESFAESVDRSWQLNQALDSGTNPDAVNQIIESIKPHVAGLKLGGAGGGGFMFILGKDAEHTRLLRNNLETNPPNDRARFVGMSVSSTGLQVTRS